MQFLHGQPRFASALPTSAAEVPHGLRVDVCGRVDLRHTGAAACAAMCISDCDGCASIGLIRPCGRHARHAQVEHTCASCWALPRAVPGGGRGSAQPDAKRCRVTTAEVLVAAVDQIQGNAKFCGYVDETVVMKSDYLAALAESDSDSDDEATEGRRASAHGSRARAAAPDPLWEYPPTRKDAPGRRAYATGSSGVVSNVEENPEALANAMLEYENPDLPISVK
eukprot:6545372-Heterocapsa_arctica.AAC.1